MLLHQAIFANKDVIQVNIPAEAGDMGVLANHVPSIEALRPGVVEIIEAAGGSQKFFGAQIHHHSLLHPANEPWHGLQCPEDLQPSTRTID